MSRGIDWVKKVRTVDAVDETVVNAMMDNSGWQLLSVGTGHRGQTILTFGWGWDDQFERATQEDE